ncbi:MAG: 50S ribosomal protein L31 [Balneolaceae bacterium]|nr:50S ribosomal protein L31 [Balneolaceae bacterium]
MKKGIHPEYNEIKVVLSDGTEFTTRSTMDAKEGVYHSEVDSKNHPFYTDNMKLQKKADRIDRFNKRYGKDSEEE